MIDLLRRDPAIRALPRALLIGGMFASVLEGVRTLLAFRAAAAESAASSTGQLLLLSLVLWVPLSIYLMLGGVAQRCSRLDLVLPVPARRLWSTHMTGILLSGAAVLAIAAGVVGLHQWLIGMIPGAARPPLSELRHVLGPVLAIGAVFVVLLQTLNPSVFRIPAGPARRTTAAAAVLVGPVLVLLLVRLPFYVWSIVLALAVAQAIRVHRILPESFTMLARRAVAGVTRRIVPAATAAGSGAWQPGAAAGSWRTSFGIFRVLCAGVAPGQLVDVPVTYMAIPFLLLWGMALSGFPLGDDVTLSWVSLTAYLLFAFLPAPMAQVRVLDPLPVARGRIFAMMILPGLALVALGYAGGKTVQTLGEPSPAIQYHDGRSRLFPSWAPSRPVLRVPMRFCEFAGGSEPPAITSPWGETHAPISQPLYRGSGVLLYSPFATDEESSPEFSALQLSRAVGAIYGHSIAPDEIQARFFSGKSSGTLLEQFPELGSPLTTPRAPVLFLLVGWLFLLMAAIYFRAFRATISDAFRKGLVFGAAGVLIVVQVLPVVGDISGLLDQRMPTAVLDIAVRRASQALPAGPLAIWVACAALFLAGFFVAGRQFERIEASIGRKTQDG